jgi:hypothetical protein
MKKDGIAKVAGLLMMVALVSVGVTGTLSAATHTVFAEFGTATW